MTILLILIGTHIIAFVLGAAFWHWVTNPEEPAFHPEDLDYNDYYNNP